VSESTRDGFSVDLNNLSEKLKEVLHEGNVRRLIVKKDDQVLAEFPLTAAVIGAVVAPILAAVGAIAALVTDCKIEVERTDEKDWFVSSVIGEREVAWRSLQGTAQPLHVGTAG